MLENNTTQSPAPGPRPLEESWRFSSRADRHNFRLLAYIGSRASAPAVAAHAAAVASGLRLSPVMASVIDPVSWDGPADPIGWHTRQLEQELEIKRLVREAGFGPGCDIVTETGCPADTLPRIVKRVGASLVVAAKRDDLSAAGLGTTANSLLERTDGALLLVPAQSTSAKVRYRRILVPIDGSARADSALPVAQRIAHEHDAELWLVHVLPRLAVVDEQRCPKLRNLRDTLDDHNRCELERHMRELQVQLSCSGVRARVQIAGPGDPRLILRDLLDTQGADLVVMTSHGTTGIESLSCGSMTHFMLGLPRIPVLVLRPGFHCEMCHDTGLSKSTQSAFTFN